MAKFAPQKLVTPSADTLASSAKAASKRGPAPVHLWNPPFCGDIDMEIRRDGTWFYLGTPIGRPALVRHFSTILKREGDAYFLVTPVEKVGIRVEDAPFLATDFTVSTESGAQTLTFTTLTGDVVTADAAHPIRVVRDPGSGEPAPYVLVRANLEALIDRKSFYRLVDLGEEAELDGTLWFGVRSAGIFFPIIPAAELEGL